MKLIRAMFFTLAVLLPTSWTIAHAEGMGGASGEKKSKEEVEEERLGRSGRRHEEGSSPRTFADLVGGLTVPDDRPRPASAERASHPRHHWIVRVTHWVNALALAIMIGSGLRIFNAYPAFARKGESFCCYPFEGHQIPAWLTFGGWLAGARHWHFAAMWLLVRNGLVYLGFIYLHGEWRDLVPRRGVVARCAGRW